MSVSDRIRQGMVRGSWIRKMFEEGSHLREHYGDDKVFDLSLGNPIVEPPARFREELRKLANNPIPGMHRYMENAGYLETRAAVAAQLSVDAGIEFTLDDIVMTCGAAGALNVVLKTILDPGDEIIISAPYFAEYINYIDNHDGIPRIIPSDEQFIPKLDILQSTIGPRTRAILINSPNNPSGAVYGEDFLREVSELLRSREVQYRKQIFLISDEAYRKLVYDGRKLPQIWPHYQSSIVITSHSKDLALPGERIGYIAIHPKCKQKKELVDGFVYCNRVLGYVNAPALMQHIVRHLQSVNVSIPEYQRKRDFLYKNLKKMGYSLIRPQGAFYMFPRSPLDDDIAFVKALQEWRVLVVPGSGFGMPGYFRVSYCVDYKTLQGSMEGFDQVARKFKLC